jgi:hypothetical protein
MRRFVIGLILGLLLSALLSQPAVAQTTMRMFGTLSNGQSRPILVDSTGAVSVAFQ